MRNLVSRKLGFEVYMMEELIFWTQIFFKASFRILSEVDMTMSKRIFGISSARPRGFIWVSTENFFNFLVFYEKNPKTPPCLLPFIQKKSTHEKKPVIQTIFRHNRHFHASKMYLKIMWIWFLLTKVFVVFSFQYQDKIYYSFSFCYILVTS